MIKSSTLVNKITRTKNYQQILIYIKKYGAIFTLCHNVTDCDIQHAIFKKNLNFVKTIIFRVFNFLCRFKMHIFAKIYLFKPF